MLLVFCLPQKHKYSMYGTCACTCMPHMHNENAHTHAHVPEKNIGPPIKKTEKGPRETYPVSSVLPLNKSAPLCLSPKCLPANRTDHYMLFPSSIPPNSPPPFFRGILFPSHRAPLLPLWPGLRACAADHTTQLLRRSLLSACIRHSGRELPKVLHCLKFPVAATGCDL